MVGKTIAQYHIEEQLGSGGMGIVYKATDTRLHRGVALKFLPPHMSSDENAKERFMQEARAASALDHSNICTIYEVGQADDGQLFIAMAFYEGQTLKYILEDRKIDPSEAVLIGHQISAGLSRAHEAGIVHRDIKPANIMVTDRGEVKILDFGVAKLSESADLTKVGSTIGTAAYMSPEQARGEKVDTRADIWSVGILLYEMLAGERPFAGTYEAAFVYAIMNEEPDPIEAPLPEGLADVVSKCLRKLPEDRYQSCSELAAALDPFLSPSGAKQAAAAAISSAPLRATVAAVPSPVKIIGLYSVAAVVVSGFVYAVMIGFGLPDWVFTGGAVLMVLGLPALLFAAHTEKSSSGASWLTFKRALWGGVISMSSLSLVTAAFMVMRVLGIGPAATLQSAGVLDEDAKLIVAEFDNQTQDATLGSSVTELLKIDLSQSDAITLMDGSDIISVLNRMNRAPESKIDLNTAMEIAAREGAEAVIAGDIRQIGAGFSISARLLGASDGAELEAFRVTADDDTRIISAIDKLSASVREQIGESIKTIRSNTDLERVTTGSLDALRLYSQGVAATDAGDHDRSIELLNQSVAIDSNFAMAYRKLAVVYQNSQSSYELALSAASKAFELRDRLPEREQWLATAYYYATIDDDRDQRIATYESILEKYPDDISALNNVSIDYNFRGEYDKAEGLLKRAIEIGDRPVFYTNLLNTLSGQKKWDDLDAMIRRFDETNPEHPNRSGFRFLAAMARGEYEDADTLIRRSDYNSNPFYQIEDAGSRADYAIYRGQLADWEREQALGARLQSERGVASETLGWRLAMADARIRLAADMDGARRILQEALSEVSVESLDVSARPYSDLISLYARLGEIDRAKALLDEYELLVPDGVRKGNVWLFQAEAEIHISENRLEEALASLERAQTIDRCAGCFLEQQAEILVQLDRLEEAAERLASINDFSQAGPFWYIATRRPLAFFLTGEVHARLGNTDAALEAFSEFVDLWKDADPELQPRVQAARDEIDRLLDIKAREPQ